MIQPQVRLLSLLNKIMAEIKLYNNGKIEAVSFDEKDDYFGFSNTGAVVASEFIETDASLKTANNVLFAKEFIEV